MELTGSCLPDGWQLSFLEWPLCFYCEPRLKSLVMWQLWKREQESGLACFREVSWYLKHTPLLPVEGITETGLTHMCSGRTGKGIVSQIRSSSLRLYLLELTVRSSFRNSSNYWMTSRFEFVGSWKQRGVSLLALFLALPLAQLCWMCATVLF